MAGFKIDSFRGIRPKMSPRKIAPGEAQEAVDVQLGSGDLIPRSGPSTETASLAQTAVKVLHRFDNAGSPVWFEWQSADVSVARGPVRDDVLERTYYTGDGFPKMTYQGIATSGIPPYPSNFRRLGLPPPAAAPAITAPAIASTIVGNTGTITDGMESDNFYLTIINSVWDIVTGYTPPYNDRVYVNEDSTDPLIANPIDVGVEVGDVYTVTVIDDDTFSIANDKSEYLTKSPVPTSPRDGSTSDSTLFITDNAGNYSNFAGYVHAPNGLIVNKTAHGLNDGAEILVTDVTVPVRYRYETPNTHNPTGGGSGSLPYFEIDYPSTGPYPTGPDNSELTTHQCTFDTAGNHFALYGSWSYEVISEGTSSTTIEERAYVYTYVTALGEEGPPSPVSAFNNIIDGSSVTIGTFSAPPGSSDGYDIDNIRIYRTNSTDDDADFQFVAEIDIATASYADVIANTDLGEILPSTDWDRPDEDMQGIISLPNGMMMGFKGKTVFFSEPYFPHAWPAIYDQAVDYDIVGLAAIGNSGVILTTGTPYIATGGHPRNVNIRPYKINQACVSKRSIAQTNDRVMYASPDGLVEIGIDGASIATEDYFTKKEWQAFNPSSMFGQVHDGKYIVFYDTAAGTPAPALVDDFDSYTDDAGALTPLPYTLGTFDIDISPDTDTLTLEDDSFPEATTGLALHAEGSTTAPLVFFKKTDSSQFSVSEVRFAFDNHPSTPGSIEIRAYHNSAADAETAADETVTVVTTDDGNEIIVPLDFEDIYAFAIGGGSGIGDSMYVTQISTYPGEAGGLIFSADNPTEGVSTSLVQATAAYVDIETDVLYYVAPSDGIRVTGIIALPDLDDVSYDSVSPTFAQEYQGFAMDVDGQYIYVTSIVDHQVRRFTLSTPFDVTTLGSFDAGASSAISSTTNYVKSMAVSSQSDKFFATRRTNDEVAEFSFGTNLDHTTINATPVATQAADVNASGVHVTRNGDYLFTCGDTSRTVRCFALSTPFDLSTASLVGSAGSVSTEVVNCEDIIASDDGTRLWALDITDNTIHQYTMSTPYDASTLSYDNKSMVLNSSEINPTSMFTVANEPAMFIGYYGNPGVNDCIVEKYDWVPTGEAATTEIASAVYEWDAVKTSPVSMRWKSGKYLTRSPVNMGAAVVEAENYPVTFKLWADEQLRATRTVSDNEPFRLPGGYLASRFEVEVSGTNQVSEVKVAENIFELSEG